MRTYLTRLTLSAAGVVLTGIGMATAAHAGDEGLGIVGESPRYVEETQPLQPVDKCEIDFTIEECGLPVGEEPKPVFTPDPGLIDPGVLGGVDDDPGSGADPSEDPEDAATEDPEGGASEDPEDAATEDPEDGEPDPSEGGGQEELAGEPGDTGSGSESGGAPDAASDPSGDAGDGSGETPSDDTASQNVTDEPTPGSDESTITPSVQSASSEGGGSDLLFAVLVSALAAFGLGIIGFGLGRRPQPVRSRR